MQYLIDAGFSQEVIEAIKVLTHSKDIPYLEYIASVKGNKIATKVKIEDLNHNLDLTRLDNISEDNLERFEKYKKALEILTN